MADILLQDPQSADTLRFDALFARSGYTIPGDLDVDRNRSSKSEIRESAVSPDGHVFDQSVHQLLFYWASRISSLHKEPAEEIAEEFTEDFEVDYSYMDRMADAARNALGMCLTDEQAQAYAGLSDFSYALDDDE